MQMAMKHKIMPLFTPLLPGATFKSLPGLLGLLGELLGITTYSRV